MAKIGQAPLKNARELSEIGYEIWRLNDIEYWCGFNYEEIVKAAVEQTGVPRDELLDGPWKLGEFNWDKFTVTLDDEPFQPKYTFTNYINMLCEQGQEFPCMLCSEEY